MKKTLYLIALFVSTLISTSCGIKSKKEKLQAYWIAQEAIIYENGEKISVKADEDDNIYVGSVSNPVVLSFNEYDELVYTTYNNTYVSSSTKDPIRAFGYVLDGDTIRLEGAGNSHIKELTDSTLIIETERKIEYYDQKDAYGQGKTIITTIYSKGPNA